MHARAPFGPTLAPPPPPPAAGDQLAAMRASASASAAAAAPTIDMAQVERIRRLLDEFSDDSGDDEFLAELAEEAGDERPPTQRGSPHGHSAGANMSVTGGMSHWQPVRG